MNLQLLATVQYIKHQAKLHCFKQNFKLNLQSTLAQSLYIALLMMNAILIEHVTTVALSQ